MTTILAIDDQIDNLTTIKAVIKNGLPKCKLITAISGKEGIKLAKEELPDTILLDIFMPEMDGYEVCKRLKEDEVTKNIPVVMITAIKTDSESRVKALNLGADAFLSKPIDPNELIAQIKVMLRIKAAEDKLKKEKENLDDLVSKKMKEVSYQESVLSNVSNPIISLDMDYNITNWNRVAEELYGWKEKEVLGKNVKEILLIEYPNETREETINTILRKGKFIGEVVHYNKSGERLNIMISVSLIKDFNENNIGFTYAGYDITEQRKTQNALKETERKSQLWLENSPVCTKIVDLDFNLQYMSSAGVKDLKIDDITKFYGKPYPLYFYTDSFKTSMKKSLEEVKRSGKSILHEDTLKDNEGKELWYQSTIVPVNDDNGQLDYIMVVSLNVTARKLAEKKLVTSEEFNRSITQSAADAIISITEDGLISSWNDAAEKIFGYSSSEMLNRNLSEIIPEKYQKKHIEGINRIKFGGKEKIIGNIVELTTALRKNGSEFSIELSLSRWSIDNQNYFTGIIRDITERKKAEEELRLHSEIMENLTEGVYLVGLDDITIKYTNTKFIDMFGYEPGEMIGKHASIVNAPFDKDPRETAKEIIDILNETGEWHGEVNNIKKDGTTFWCYANVSIFNHSKYGKVIVAIHTDITERKKIEEDLKNSLIKATESDRVKSAFLATMSHELRTPLNAVIGFSDLIDEDVPIEDIVQFSNTINTSGKHLLNIVEDLFDITLIEAGEVNLAKTDVNLNKLLHEVHQIIVIEQQKLKKSHISLDLEIPKILDNIVVHTDASKLKQILINLLKNALKFTSKGYIKYGFETIANKKDQGIKFFVEDSGIGIAKEKYEVIFDVFRQVDDSHTRKYGGTGIGLSLSKKLVDVLDGKIWVESEVDKGSVFYFTIPASLEAYDQKIKDLELNAGHTLKNSLTDKRILIAEDDESSYEYLKVILGAKGVDLLWAQDGEEAIKYCKEDKTIDLVLMDINMPVMNGLIATKAIKKFKPDLPIIAQTAYAIAGDKEKALEAGCDDYISKPVNKKEILEKIEYCLSKK